MRPERTQVAALNSSGCIHCHMAVQWRRLNAQSSNPRNINITQWFLVPSWFLCVLQGIRSAEEVEVAALLAVFSLLSHTYGILLIYCLYVLQGIRSAEEVEVAAAPGSGAFYSPAEVQAMDPKQVLGTADMSPACCTTLCLLHVKSLCLPAEVHGVPTQSSSNLS